MLHLINISFLKAQPICTWLCLFGSQPVCSSYLYDMKVTFAAPFIRPYVILVSNLKGHLMNSKCLSYERTYRIAQKMSVVAKLRFFLLLFLAQHNFSPLNFSGILRVLSWGTLVGTVGSPIRKIKKKFRVSVFFRNNLKSKMSIWSFGKLKVQVQLIFFLLPP